MADFINTVDELGEDVVITNIIERSITEFKDNTITTVGSAAFYNCTSLKKIDLPNVTSIKYGAFRGCGFDVADFPFVNGDIPQDSFSYNPNLKKINFPLATSIGYCAISDCTALEKVVLPSVKYAQGFRKCKNLIEIDFPVAEKVSGYFSFSGCGVERFILRNTNVMAPLDGTTAFHYMASETTPIHKGTGYIYVPKALIEEYKVATNWSVYASQFRALEDYTIDGSTTGALDESKI